MRGVNKVILVGLVGKDPETKTFPNGGSLTQFSIATTEKWIDKNSGERKEQTEWHRIACNNKLAEIVAQYVKKGSKVYIEGRLKTRQWTDQSGVERYTTEISANEVQMLDSKGDTQQQNTAPKAPQYGQRQQGYAPQNNQPKNNDLDDDLPF